MEISEKEKILLDIERLKDEKENLKWECDNIFNYFLAVLIGIATICITVLLSLKDNLTFYDLILITSNFILLMIILWITTNLMSNKRENQINLKKDKIIEEYKKLGIN